MRTYIFTPCTLKIWDKASSPSFYLITILHFRVYSNSGDPICMYAQVISKKGYNIIKGT